MSGVQQCEGFEAQRFRPNFCKFCLKLKSEHSASQITQKTEETELISPRGNANNNTPSNIATNPLSLSGSASLSNALKRPPQVKRESLNTSTPPISPSLASVDNLPSPTTSSSNTNAIPTPKRQSSFHSSTSSAVKKERTPKTTKKAKTRSIRQSYIQIQQSKGEIPNASKFIQQILLRSLFVDGMKLTVNEAEDLIRRAQGCLKVKTNDKNPVLLLDKKAREFLVNHVNQISNFLEEQDDLKSIILTQSLVRRFLVLKKFRDLDKDAVSQLKRRNDNYFDLIRSEKQYVQTIERLIEHYVLPLRHSDYIAPYECASIFSNLELLAEEHKALLKKLQSLDITFPFVTGIGKTFLELSGLLKAYSVYVSNFKNAINEVERLQSENQKFESFISDKSANWIDLTTLLSMPLNRMNQYEHMMKSLLENLTQGTEDYDECIKAISVLSQSSAVIELNLVQSADTAKIQQCQRKLRADGPVALIKAGRKLHCELKTKKSSVFLFSDILIVAKPQSKAKTHRESHRGGIKSKEEVLRVLIHCNIQDVELVDLDAKTLEIRVKPDNAEKVPFGSVEEKTKWVRLFKSVLEEKNRVKVFGVPLADTVVREERSNGIPVIVEKTITHILQHHASHPGIFRVAGLKVEIDKLKAVFDLGGEEVKQLDLSVYGAFSVCDVLKLFFRSLPEPLLGYNLYKPIVDLMRNEDQAIEQKVTSMKELVLMWTPPFAVKVLKYLLKFLSEVATKSEVNKMTSSNLSIVFGPTLLWSETNTLESAMDMPYINSFVQALIDHQETIFGK